MAKSLYQNKKKWEISDNEKKLCSFMNREKNYRKWDNFKNIMRTYLLKSQIRHDSWIINTLRVKYPQIYGELIKEHDIIMGKSLTKKQRIIEFIEMVSPRRDLYVGKKAGKTLDKLKEVK